MGVGVNDPRLIDQLSNTEKRVASLERNIKLDKLRRDYSDFSSSASLAYCILAAIFTFTISGAVYNISGAEWRMFVTWMVPSTMLIAALYVIRRKHKSLKRELEYAELEDG